jgi:SAM-dependent methyltransferase
MTRSQQDRFAGIPGVPVSIIPESQRICKSCGAGGMRNFYEIRGIPVHSCMLLPTRAEASTFPRGDLALGFCSHCGFISNLLFDSRLQNYAPGYEEQQSFSERFNDFARTLATRLLNRYNLRDKTIVEIGCGKGDFLLMMCELGGCHGIGIDPSFTPGRIDDVAADRVRFIQDLYSEKYASLTGEMILCRHTLEHIGTTAKFMQQVRRAIGERHETVVVFEVPDVARVLREQAFWDIYYEHCSYFTLGSLARLFRSCGFEILDLAKDYDDQYLLIEARPVNGHTPPQLDAEDDLAEIAHDVALFEERFQKTAAMWRAQLDEIVRVGRRVAIWGSGSKCVSFLSTLGVCDEIQWIVDINPYRHGKFLAGSGIEIRPPAMLREYQPDLVIVMNPIYREEIRKTLEQMNLRPELLAV